MGRADFMAGMVIGGGFSFFLSVEEKINLSRIGAKSTGCVTTTQPPCRLFLTFRSLIFA